MPYKNFKQLRAGTYEVNIESSLAPGSLTYGECYLPGKTKEEVLLSTYLCHPSLGNDNLSGVVLLTFLASILKKRKLKYSYRFLFIPETIGALAWLSHNEKKLPRIKHGLVVTCVGDSGKMTYKKSRRANAEIDRIVGLEMGADDYLAKPFNPRELLARIKSILRRAQSLPPNLEAEDIGAFRFADWSLDVAARHLVAPDGLVVPLSGAEYRLLRVFLEHAQRVLSRDQLLELANGREAILFDRSIDVLVGRLRKRLRDDGREPQLVKTVRGEGYVLAASVARA